MAQRMSRDYVLHDFIYLFFGGGDGLPSCPSLYPGIDRNLSYDILF